MRFSAGSFPWITFTHRHTHTHPSPHLPTMPARTRSFVSCTPWFLSLFPSFSFFFHLAPGPPQAGLRSGLSNKLRGPCYHCKPITQHWGCTRTHSALGNLSQNTHTHIMFLSHSHSFLTDFLIDICPNQKHAAVQTHLSTLLIYVKLFSGALELGTSLPFPQTKHTPKHKKPGFLSTMSDNNLHSTSTNLKL